MKTTVCRLGCDMKTRTTFVPLKQIKLYTHQWIQYEYVWNGDTHNRSRVRNLPCATRPLPAHLFLCAFLSVRLVLPYNVCSTRHSN
jgi:hypothetical protein